MSAMTSFPVMECTVAQVHQAMLDGKLTCRELTEAYLARIQSYDQQGPALNAIIAINPQALEESERLDRQLRETGALSGPLHGIPVLLKDNVGTCDMPTTAGSRSLEGFVPSEDAFLTKRLRQAGALILAKTNLHEFAIWGETISSILGQTRNPYDLTRTPGGSSGGTGAAIAANMGLIGIGTDTINSIRSPSSANSLVGIRPTLGLVSRSGIVPYSMTQDTAGPICRTVEDAVRTLDVIAGYDRKDAKTAWCVDRKPESYLNFLNPDGMRGRRIGVLESFFGTQPVNQAVSQVVREALRYFGRENSSPKSSFSSTREIRRTFPTTRSAGTTPNSSAKCSSISGSTEIAFPILTSRRCFSFSTENNLLNMKDDPKGSVFFLPF